MKDVKSSSRVKPGTAPISSGHHNYSATSSSSSTSTPVYYNASEKDARYAYRREEKPYPPSSRGYHGYSQPTDASSSRTHSYHSESYSHRPQPPENDRSNGSIGRMPTSSLPPLPSSNGSPNTTRSPYGSEYYSGQQRPTSSWSRSPVPPPPSLPPLHGYGSSRNLSPTIRPSILPPPPQTSSAAESRSSIPPPLPLPKSTRDQANAPSSSQVSNNNIFHRPLTAFLWSDGAAPARPPMNDRILPPVPKNTGDPMRSDSYYERS